MNKGLAIAAAAFVGIIVLSLLGAYMVSREPSSMGKEKVAVVRLEGPIEMSSPEGGLISSQSTSPREFENQLEKATEDSSIKAIVLYVNTPGGSVVATEEMARAVKEARSKKPVVSWLGEIATSGGYYVASASDHIVADPATITGSIGVISIFPEYSELLEKIGVNMTVIKGGRYKDFSTGYRPMKEEEREMMEELVNSTYRLFIQEVAKNRNLSKEYVKGVAQGRIYSGTRAVEINLADETGSFDRAVEKAADMGGIEGEPKLVTYQEPSFFREVLYGSFESLGYGFARGFADSEMEYQGELRY